MEHLDDDKLQRYFDGELTDGEATVMRREIEASDLEKARIRQLERLGELMQLDAEVLSEDLDSDALFASIEAGIAEEGPRLQLIEGARRKQRAGVAVAVAVAIAAAVTLVLLLKPPADNVAERHPMDTDREEIAIEIEDPQLHILHPPAGSEVVRIDFGSNTGTIFQVEGNHGQPLAVVWIDEEQTP